MPSNHDLDWVLNSLENEYVIARRIFLIGLLFGAVIVIMVEHFVSSMSAIPFAILFVLWTYAWYERIRNIRYVMDAIVSIREHK